MSTGFLEINRRCRIFRVSRKIRELAHLRDYKDNEQWDLCDRKHDVSFNRDFLYL